MSTVRVAPDLVGYVLFDPIRPAGARILLALDRVARATGTPLLITCGSNGHPPTDPHTLGEAYDVRSHELTEVQKGVILRAILHDLADGEQDIEPVSGGLASSLFFGWLEDPGTDNEHFHIQRRRGIQYPPHAFLV